MFISLPRSFLKILDYLFQYILVLITLLTVFLPPNIDLGSMSVNVTVNSGTGRSEFVNAGELSGSISIHEGLHKLIAAAILAFFLHITLILLVNT